MSIPIETSADLTLETIEQITRSAAPCALTTEASDRIDRRRVEFIEFVRRNEDRHLYGITTKHHTGAKTILDDAGRDDFAHRIPPTPAGFGAPLPERIVRGVIVCRLTDILNGTGCTRAETARRILAILDGDLPEVPMYGVAGDITVLSQILRRTMDGTLERGEGMALINGSPVSSALLADAVLDGRQRIAHAERVMALSAVAFGAPVSHYGEPLDAAWGDQHQAQSIRAIRELIESAGPYDQLPHQAPCSFRASARSMGGVRRIQANAEECAEIALTASSNNPMFVAPDEDHPYGDVISNGGYENPMVTSSLDSLGRAWADVCQIVTAQINRLVEDPNGLASTEPESRVTLLQFSSAALSEEARANATVTLNGFGSGQTDIGTSDLVAWQKAIGAGRALDRNLAVMSVISCHTIARSGRAAPTGELGTTYRDVLQRFPISTAPVDFRLALAEVEGLFTPSGVKQDRLLL